MVKSKKSQKAPAKPKPAKSGAPAPRNRAKVDKPDPIRQIADWIIAGNSDFQIDEAAAAMLGISKKAAEKFRHDAYRFLGELIEADPELRKTWHVAARMELYRRTISIHDYKTARDVLRDLGQLEGLYPKAVARKAAAGDQAENETDIFPTTEGIPLFQ